MKLSVIPEDRLIVKDNVPLVSQDNWPFDDNDIRAIQWNGDSGEVEYHDITMDNAAAEQSVVDAYATFYDTVTAERAAAKEAALNEAVYNYADVRKFFYPSIEDQLDAAYWASQGDTTKQDEVNAKISQVKTDYPKDMALISQNQLDALVFPE
jgi:hypothetical protein